MTDLQLALLALGATIIAAVILFNWLQESRIRRETVRRFDGPIKDALMVGNDELDAVSSEQPFQKQAEIQEEVLREEIVIERFELKVEPTFSFDSFHAEPAENHVDAEGSYDTHEEAPEPFVATESFVSPEPLATAEATPLNVPEPSAIPEPAIATQATVATPTVAASGLPPNVDEQIDYIAVITLAQPSSGAVLREAMLPLPQFDKNSQWMGLTASGLWRHFTKDQEHTQFSLVVGTLQLADRAGPISAGTLADFRRKAEDSAARLHAQLEWRGHANPQRYAQELDQFCIEVDVMVSLHLMADKNNLFAGTKLRGLAEAGGMTLQDDGVFHYVDDNNETQFTLVNQSAPFSVETLRTSAFLAVSLQLDVTRVSNCTEAFSRMTTLAKRMEQGLSAKLVDDNQRVLGDVELEKIRQQLKKIYSSMVAHYVPPGSPTALRLFS